MARVLTEKTWKPELLVQLVMGLMLCFGLSAVIVGLVVGNERPLTSDKEFLGMVVSSLTLHGGCLLVVFFLLRQYNVTLREGFGIGTSPAFAAIGIGVVAAVFFLPAAWFLGQVSDWLLKGAGMQPELQTPVKILQESTTISQKIFFGFMAVVLAPVAEEVVFRGVLYSAGKQAGFPRAAMWGSSLLFAAIHFNAMAFIPLTLLALLLIWLYERTGNLLTCIAAHAFFNLVNIVLLLNQPAIEQWLKKQQQAMIWF